MNNEETILDSQSVTESNSSKSETPVSKNSDTGKNESSKRGTGVASKLGSAAVGVAAGVAGTMYATNANAATMPGDEKIDETPSSPTDESKTTQHGTPDDSPTKTPGGQDPTPQDPEVKVVEVREVDLNGDGQTETAALLSNGVVLVDIDNDGVAEVAMKDLNGNGILDEGEVANISSEHIIMPQAVETSNPSSYDNGVDVHVINVGQADLNQDGVNENVALVEIEGNEVLLVDIDQDNVADVAICDANGNGNLDNGEAVDITAQNIEMPSMSDGDMYMTSADSEPDYMDDADTEMYDA